MEFEFDPKKSESNKKKHGIDFIDAQKLWDDGGLVSFPAKTSGESRSILIGKVNGIFWTAVTTIRKPDKIRIISVRKSRQEEKKLYES